MSNFFVDRLVLCGLIMMGVLGSSVGKEVAKTVTSDQSVQDAVGVVTGVATALSPIVGLMVWNQTQQNKKSASIASLINISDESSRKRINRKVSTMFQQLDRVRSYERHMWGIGDFTPFIRVRRYVKPTPEVISDIDQLEKTLISYIVQYRNEAAVDEALHKATEIVTSIISQLDQAK